MTKPYASEPSSASLTLGPNEKIQLPPPQTNLVTSASLKFTWYDKLGPGEMYLDERVPVPALAEEKTH
jgi:hypothetical protein